MQRTISFFMTLATTLFIQGGKQTHSQENPQNTKAVPKPERFGDVFHYNLVYGDGRAIGGIYY